MNQLFTLLLLFILTVPSYQLESTCTYRASDGSFYNLNSLKRKEGFLVADGRGDTWYFNFCSDLSEMKNTNCSKNSYVCKISNGKPINAGKQITWQDYVNPKGGIEILFTEGDKCGNRNMQTSIHLLCNNSNDKKNLTSLKVIQVDSCSTIITAESGAACPVIEDEDNDSEVYGYEASEYVNFLLLTLAIFVCGLCICCCCISHRTRSKDLKKREDDMIKYSDFAFEPLVEDPSVIQLQRMEPHAPFAPEVSSFVNQNNNQVAPIQNTRYFQAPEYFLYPSVQPPTANINSFQIVTDEVFARKLQDELNREM